MQWPLHLLLWFPDHVVAKVIEAELVVSPVGDVRLIGVTAGHRPPVIQPLVRVLEWVGVLGVVDRGEFVRDDADSEAECRVDGSHPAAAQSRQVVVGGNQVRAFAFDRVQVQGQRGDQRLAFTSPHLGDTARVQHRAGEHLHVVVAFADGAARGFAGGRERFGQQVVEAFALLEAAAELGRFVAQRLVRQRLIVLLQGVDLGEDGLESFDFALGGVAADFAQPVEHSQLSAISRQSSVLSCES